MAGWQWRLDVFCSSVFYDYTRRWVLGVGDNQVTRPWMDVLIAFIVFYT
jgi:hypothetical protein